MVWAAGDGKTFCDQEFPDRHHRCRMRCAPSMRGAVSSCSNAVNKYVLQVDSQRQQPVKERGDRRQIVDPDTVEIRKLQPGCILGVCE